MINFFNAVIENVKFFLAVSRDFMSLHISNTSSSDFSAFYFMIEIYSMTSFVVSWAI